MICKAISNVKSSKEVLHSFLRVIKNAISDKKQLSSSRCSHNSHQRVSQAGAACHFDRMCCELKMQDQSLQISSSPLRYFQWVCKTWEHPTDAESAKTKRNYRSEIVQSLWFGLWIVPCSVVVKEVNSFSSHHEIKIDILFVTLCSQLTKTSV